MGVLKGAKRQIAVRVTAEIEQDLGKTLRVPFVAVFRRLRSSEYKEVLRRIDAQEIDDADIVRQYLVEWRDLEGEDGPIPYSDEMREEMIEEPAYLRALIEGFFAAQVGAKALRRKN